MKALPNNCRYGKISVHPANWKSGGVSLLKQDWYIKYRFYDDNIKQSKQVVLKGFNKYHEMQDRREAIKGRIILLKEDLEKYGFNPISKDSTKSFEVLEDEDVSKSTPFLEALNYAKTLMQVSPNTMANEIEFVIGRLSKFAKELKYDRLCIWETSLKNLYLLCEKASYKEIKDGKKVIKSFSGDKFNRNKKVLRQLYTKLLMLEVVPANLPMSLERAKGAPKQKKKLLTPDEIKKLKAYMQEYPRFGLFVDIFFHSGSRLTEMLRVKVKDVDLKAGYVTYLALKGNNHGYKERPIKHIATDLWKEVIAGAKKTDYVWSDDLMPGAIPATTNTIKKRWQRLERATGITGGMYQLKHLNTTQTANLIGVAGAAAQNAESREMIIKHYHIDNDKNQNELIRNVNNPL